MGDWVHWESTTFESHLTTGHGDLRGDTAQLPGHAAPGDQQQHDRVILRHIADPDLCNRDDWSMQCDLSTDISFSHGHLRGWSSYPVVLRSLLLHGVSLWTRTPDSTISVARHWRRRHVCHHAEPRDYVRNGQVLGHFYPYCKVYSNIRCGIKKK